MKRQLTREERGVTERALKGQEKKLTELKEDKDMAEETIKFELAKRAYNDKVRPYTRKREDTTHEKQLKDIQYVIDETQQVVDITQDQLNNGIEQKGG